MNDRPAPSVGELKNELQHLETCLIDSKSAITIVNRLEQILDLYRKKQLSYDDENYFLTSCFPKVVIRLTKTNIPSEEAVQRVFKFFRVAMLLIIETIPRNIVLMAEALQNIFNHHNPFYFQDFSPQEKFRLEEDELWANVPQSSFYSELTMDAINFFGGHNGFLILFEHVAKDSTPIPAASAFMSAANQCLICGYITRQKIPDYIAGALGSLKRLHNMSANELRRSKKEDYENIIRTAQNILRYKLKSLEIAERVEYTMLEVARQCISSTSIEKRLYGVNHIAQVIEALLKPEHRRYDIYAELENLKPTAFWITTQYMETWLTTNAIVEQLFGPKRHQQLLKPSAPILRFLAQREKLQSSDINTLWVCATTTHESIAQITLQLISDISGSLQPSHFSQFFKKVQEIPRKDINSHMLSFIAALARNSKEPHLRIQFLELLWGLVVDDDLPIETSKSAYKHVDEVVRLDSFAHLRRPLIEQVVMLLENPTTKSKGLLLKSLLVSQQEMSTIINWLSKLCDMQSKLQQEIMKFKETCCAEAKSRNVTNTQELYDSVLIGRLPYREELKARLDALAMIVNLSGEPMSMDRLLELWDMLYVNALTDSDKQDVVAWFSNGLNNRNGGLIPVINSASAARLFSDKILQIPVASMSYAEFQCFAKYFIESNAHHNNVKLDGQNEFVVTKLPDHLFGYDALWQLVLDCPSTQVVDAAIELLIKVHEKISTELQQTHKLQIREAFISCCMSYLAGATKLLRSSKEDLDSQVSNQQRTRVIRCISLLMKLVDATEPNTSKQTTITRGIPIQLKVTVNTGIPNVPKFSFSVLSDSNSYYRPLRAYIFEHIKKEVEKYNQDVQINEDDLVFLRADQNSGAPIDGLDGNAGVNHTLSQLAFKDKDLIVVRHRPSIRHRQSVYRLRSRVAQQLEEPAPHDAAEKANNLVDMWGISKELAMFALRKYGWDMNRVADVFVDESKQSELLAEARKAGITGDYDRTEVPSTEEEVSQMMTAKTAALLDPQASILNADSSLPTTIITRSSNLDTLFELLKLNDEQISHLLWDFMQRIPASPDLKQQLLAPILSKANDESDTKPAWDKLFPTDEYRLSYTLRLTDQILFPFDSSQYIDARTKWAVWFMETGGLSQLINSFNSIALADSTLIVAVQHLAECLTLALKVIDMFLSLQTTNCDSPPNNFISSLIHNVKLPLSEEESIRLPLINKLVDVLKWTSSFKKPHGALVDYAWRVFIDVLSNASTEWRSDVLSKLDGLSALINDLLLCDVAPHRVQTSRRLLDLCQLSQSLETSIVSSLISAIPDATSHLESKQYQRFAEMFWLLERLVSRSFKRHETVDENAIKSTYDKLIGIIKTRPVTEMSASYPSDEILAGSMRLLAKIVRGWSGAIIEDDLLHELYHDCLFAIKTHKCPLPKCKNISSRVAAYKLLTRIADRDESYRFKIFQLLARNHPGPYHKIDSWDYYVGHEDRAPVGYVGINNLGATCYMSSLLQQFYMMPPLRRDLLATPMILPSPNATEAELQDNIVWQLQQLFGYLQESEKMSYNPKDFCASYKDLEGNSVNVSQQQDVNEFFNILCQRFESTLKGMPQEKVLARQFVVKVADEIRSLDPTVPYFSEKQDELYTIPLDVQHKSSLPEALDLFIKGDKLEGDNRVFVERAGRKIDAMKRTVIKSLSKTVIFHLKRFEFDVATYRRNKLNHRFTFPFEIDLKPWTKAGVAAKEGRTDEVEQDWPDDYYKYQLVGVLVHSGSADSGHYYSLIKERTPPYRWLQFNDRVVTEFDPEQIGPECFGGVHTVRVWDSFQRKHVQKEQPLERNAYMLFYERINHDPKFEDSSYTTPSSDTGDKDTPVSTSESATSTTSQEEEMTTFSVPSGGNVPPVYDMILMSHFLKNPDKFREAHSKSAATNSPAEEINPEPKTPSGPIVKPVELVDGVPKKIHDVIWEENASFMRERQIFDSVYFDCLLRLISNIKLGDKIEFNCEKHMPDIYSDLIEECMQRDTLFGIIKFVTRIAVEYITHAKLNISLPWWFEQLRKLFSVHVPAATWFVDYCRRNGVIKEILLLCPHERTRIEFADTCAVAMKLLDSMQVSYVPSPLKGGSSATNNQSAPCDATYAFLDIFLELLEESRPHWLRFKQFFQVIRDCAAISWRQRQYLLDKELLQLYEDYFMGHTTKHPIRARIMDDTHLPDLAEFVDTLSILIRGCHNDNPNVSPPNQIRDKVLTMPPAALNAIFNSSFFGSFLDMEYNVSATCEILKFYSYESADRSDMILDSVLNLFENGAAHKMALFEDLLEALLQIEDSLQPRRIRRGMTSVKYVSYKSPSFKMKKTGILGLARQKQEERARTAVSIAKYAVKLARDNKHVFDFLVRRQNDLIWLKEFLESKLEEDIPGFKLFPSLVEEDLARLDELAKLIIGYKDSKVEITRENWRTSSLYACIVYIEYMLRQSPQPINVDDKLMEMSDQIATLKQQHESAVNDKFTLVEAILFYQDKLPGVALPPEIHAKVQALVSNCLEEIKKNPQLAGPISSKKLQETSATVVNNVSSSTSQALVAADNQYGNSWSQISSVGAQSPKESKESTFVSHNVSTSRNIMKAVQTDQWTDEDEDFTDNEQTELIRGGRSDWLRSVHHGPFPTSESQPPSDLEERLSQLRMIFEGIDEDVLKVALRHCGWDVARTANDLLEDPTRLELFQLEAKRNKKQPYQETRRSVTQQTTEFSDPTSEDDDLTA